VNAPAETTQPTALGPLSKIRQIVLILLGMVLMGSMAWILVKKYNKPEVSAAKVVSDRLEKLKLKREAELKAVETYGWVDKNAGIVHIPVAAAVELTIRDLKAKPVVRTNIVPAPPVPAVPAAPAAPAAGAPAAAPAPAAPAQTPAPATAPAAPKGS